MQAQFWCVQYSLVRVDKPTNYQLSEIEEDEGTDEKKICDMQIKKINN